MASPSRRLQTKPVITCFKSVLLIYTFIFWVRDGDALGAPIGGEVGAAVAAGTRALLTLCRGSSSGSGISPSGCPATAAERLSRDPDVPGVRIRYGGRVRELLPPKEAEGVPGPLERPGLPGPHEVSLA